MTRGQVGSVTKEIKMVDSNSFEDRDDIKIPNGFLTGLVLMIVGLLVGGLAGAVAMLLLAPQSGKRTRKQIRRKVRDLREQATESLEGGVKQVRATARHVTTSIHDQAEDLQQRGQDVVESQKERWSPVVEAGKTAVQGS
jgi:gas vesicle protein